jgi:4-carboxymuconolactone decarboxylase
MTRINLIPQDQMTGEQKTLHDLISVQRTGGRVAGPFGVMLHAPEICESVADMVTLMLSDTRLPHPLKELVILTIARDYTAQYEWGVHERRAHKFGLDADVIEALRHRREPDFHDQDQRVVYDVTRELLANKKLSDDGYAKAVAAFGEVAVVELIALIGFYIMVAVLLVSFDVDLPDGMVPLED